MDVLTAARWEFALTAAIHYAFVATTLGLTPILTALSFAGLRGGRVGLINRCATNQLARLYLLNYAIGIISGIVMELQMGLNWTGAGAAFDPIGSMLAVETLLAFFVESTLVGLWLASAGLLSDRIRAWIMAGITATAWLSAIFIIVANSYLHRPRGFAEDGSLADPLALFTNPSALAAIPHVMTAAAITGGFWTAATGATLLLRHRKAERDGTLRPLPGEDQADWQVAQHEIAVGRRLLKTAVPLVAAAAPLTLVFGLLQFAQARPPGFTPVPSFFGAFLAVMMFGGFGIWVFTWLMTVPLFATKRLHRARWLLRVMVALGPLPLLFNISGWIYREENRQPWFIVNRVRIADALSAGSGPLVAVTGGAFVLIGLTAALVTWRLMYRAMKSPPVAELGFRLPSPDNETDADDHDELLEVSR